MENNQIFEKVVSILRRNRGEIDKEITDATSLQSDLGIDGIDAYEILNEFFKEFEVDTSHFIFSDYFGEENFDLIDFFRRKIKGKRLKKLTVGQLVQIAKQRKWPNS